MLVKLYSSLTCNCAVPVSGGVRVSLSLAELGCHCLWRSQGVTVSGGVRVSLSLAELGCHCLWRSQGVTVSGGDIHELVGVSVYLPNNLRFMFEKSPNLKTLQIDSRMMNAPGNRLRIRVTPRVFEKNCLGVSFGARRSCLMYKKRRQKIS